MRKGASKRDFCACIFDYQAIDATIPKELEFLQESHVEEHKGLQATASHRESFFWGKTTGFHSAGNLSMGSK